MRIVKEGLKDISHLLSGRVYNTPKHQGIRLICRTESKQREICNWFGQTNPSSNHNAALSLYEDGTASWVLRSQEWSAWESLQSRAVWLHGIPGAGKTIMMSYLIENVIRQCHQRGQKNNVCVYYYCYHGHNQDATTPLLRWILSQLFRQAKAIPSRAHDIFRQGREPDLASLLSLLADIVSVFDTICIMVDALDESLNRQNILALLQTLVTDDRFNNIQLFVASRDYIEIRRTMSSIFEPLSLSNSLVETDISRYISAKIATSEKIGRWPEALRTEIKEKLSAGAKGMFRWAVCQLDILQHLGQMDKVRSALQSLPETLDETYERIFSYIQQDERGLVLHALRWICFHSTIWENIPVEASTLLEIYPFLADQQHPEGNNLFDIDSPKESCGCLISFVLTDDERLECAILAHYTVREFLESDRLKNHSLYFRLQPHDGYCDLHSILITRALTATRLDVVGARICGNYKLRPNEYCLISSLEALTRRCVIGSVDPCLVFRFLNPLAPHFHVLAALLLPGCDNRYFKAVARGRNECGFWSLNWQSFAGPAVAGIFILLMLLELTELAECFLQVHDVQNILSSRLTVASSYEGPRFPHQITLGNGHLFNGTM